PRPPRASRRSRSATEAKRSSTAAIPSVDKPTDVLYLRFRMEIRHDWTKAEVRALHDLPLLELTYRAPAVHRQTIGDNTVELCSRLSVKTGGGPEDCAYCPEAARYHTGVKAEKLMPLAEVLEAAKSARSAGAARFCMGAAWREVKDGPQFEQ